MVTIRSFGLLFCNFTAAATRCLAYLRAFIVGVYEEIAWLNVLSVDPGEWTPAAWNGRRLAMPTPIHHIRRSSRSPFPSSSLRISFTQSVHSHFRNCLYCLFFSLYSPICQDVRSRRIHD